MHRRNAAYCLLGIRRLGEKTQLSAQKILNQMRDQYEEDMEIQKQIDELQERLDRQRDLMKRRLANKEVNTEEKPEPIAPAPSNEALPW